jgi:hypothetical protein
MPVKDTFSYEARWDSVGLDCSDCAHFHGPEHWPDKERVSRCELHGISLAIELGDDGYKCWEWFCRDFHDTGRAFPKAVAHFHQVRQQLQESVLYRFCGDHGYLEERTISGQ